MLPPLDIHCRTIGLQLIEPASAADIGDECNAIVLLIFATAGAYMALRGIIA